MNSAGNSLLRTKGNDEYDAYIDKVDKERGAVRWKKEINEQINYDIMDNNEKSELNLHQLNFNKIEEISKKLNKNDVL